MPKLSGVSSNENGPASLAGDATAAERSLSSLELRVLRGGVDCSEAVMPSMTKQSFKDECDINNIMSRYIATGLIDFSRDVASGRYVDLTTVDDFHSSMDKVAKAMEAFDALPANIRSAFHNNPAELLEFVSDPNNAQRAIDLGIATPVVVPITPVVDVATSAPVFSKPA